MRPLGCPWHERVRADIPGRSRCPLLLLVVVLVVVVVVVVVLLLLLLLLFFFFFLCTVIYAVAALGLLVAVAPTESKS